MPRYRVSFLEDQEFAEEIALQGVEDGKRVLWVVNTVARCQALAKKLNVLCYHSRFKLEDRKKQHGEVIAAFQQKEKPVLAITTQLCEMSLDLDADILISEVAPITSMIQRMGRCNRHTRPGEGTMGKVFFYTPEDEKPYTADDLSGREEFLKTLDGREVSQSMLEDLLEKFGSTHVEVEKYAAFLTGGPWAVAREESLRDENNFTINAILSSDIPIYFDLRKQKKPVDNDSGSKRLRGAKGQFVRQAGLSHQDDRQPRFGIFFKLADGVKFGKDFQAHQGGFINDENHFLLFFQNQVYNLFFNFFDHKGFGVAGTVSV